MVAHNVVQMREPMRSTMLNNHDSTSAVRGSKKPCR